MDKFLYLLCSLPYIYLVMVIDRVDYHSFLHIIIFVPLIYSFIMGMKKKGRILLIGSLISFILDLLLVFSTNYLLPEDRWLYCFKPFTSTSLVITGIVTFAVLQVFLFRVGKGKIKDSVLKTKGRDDKKTKVKETNQISDNPEIKENIELEKEDIDEE